MSFESEGTGDRPNEQPPFGVANNNSFSNNSGSESDREIQDDRYDERPHVEVEQLPLHDLAAKEDTSKASQTKGPELIVITGMSGAGRSEAMHTFEDLGYFCVDNLPPALLRHLMALAEVPGGERRRLAVVCDLRSQEFFDQLEEELQALLERGMTYTVLFLDAEDEILLRRFKASRRRHPLCDDGMTIIAGIHKERAALAAAKNLASSVIDTTNLRPQELRIRLREVFAEQTAKQGLVISVYSFGFKHGAMPDCDIIMDVRFLPNPYWEPELRSFTGLDEAVRLFVLDQPETSAFLARWNELLDIVIPGYVNEGKSYLTIGIGCTGGQHRSVVLAEKTGDYLRDQGYRATTSHRDIDRSEIGV